MGCVEGQTEVCPTLNTVSDSRLKIQNPKSKIQNKKGLGEIKPFRSLKKMKKSRVSN